MTICERIQQRLAEQPELAQQQPEWREHIKTCPQCRKFLQSLEQLESALQALPRQQASDDLLTRTAKAVAAFETPIKKTDPHLRRRWASRLATAAVLLAAIGLTQNLLDIQDNKVFLEFGDQIGPVARLSNQEPMSQSIDTFDYKLDDVVETFANAPAVFESETETVSRSVRREAGRDVGAAIIAPQSSKESAKTSTIGGYYASEQLASPADVSEADELSLRGQLQQPEEEGEEEDGRNGLSLEDKLVLLDKDNVARPNLPFSPVPLKTEPSKPSGSGRRADNPLPIHGFQDEKGQLKDGRITQERNHRLQRERVYEKVGEEALAKNERQFSKSKKKSAPKPAAKPVVVGGKAKRDRNVKPSGLDITQSGAQGFFAQQNALDVTVQPASGYWANHYVPGDPLLRVLETRLQGWDRSALARALGTELHLEQTAVQNRQPFDNPQRAALGLYLHADKAAVDGPSRLRLQVGLKGSPRRSGQRPSMNVGVVLDLRDIGVDSAPLRALLTALAQARQPGDRFSLIVAGRPGGLLLPPDQFRHGPLQLAMGRLFAESIVAGLDLPQALSLAMETVSKHDDADAVLGSSLLLLVTASPLTGQQTVLERLVHESAVAGAPTSVVTLGNRPDPNVVQQLVLAGQGNRRVLDSVDTAADLIAKELHAASRLVARALRLRIRLAPGVKLVQVLGSQRLQQPQVQRVREAEQSIDRRMARNLGIKADRGEDEEGIQIVIPGFYAGDSHVILLDLLVPGPGAVADVTVRYKDLINLGNGIVSARMDLAAGQQASGHLERNVLKNQLALMLAEATRQAGHHLAAGQRAQAIAALTSIRDLFRGLRQAVVGWSRDAELLRDEAMLSEYLNLLQSSVVAEAVAQGYVADSLRYTALRKLLPGTESE